MPQNIPCVVTPTDPEPQWPTGYIAALREAGAVEKTIPYCIGWVRRFFAAYPGRKRRDLGRAEIEAFLGKIARQISATNWHVQQARDALEVYYERFRGIALDPRADIPKSHAVSAPTLRAEAPNSGAAKAKAFLQLSHTEAMCARRCECVKDVSGGVSDGRQVREISVGTTQSLRPACPAAIREDVPSPMAPAQPVARAPIPAQLVAPDREGERPREPRRPGLPPGSMTGTGRPAGSVNWRVLEEKLRECLRIEHYSYRTEQTYVGWIRRFVIFHQWRKPSALEAKDVHEFLRHLALDEQVASSTQNQARKASCDRHAPTP